MKKIYSLKFVVYDLYKLELSINTTLPWWRHQIETFCASLVLCEGNPPVTGVFPSWKPVMRSYDVFFDLRLNKRLSKQSLCRWFETQSRSLWHHCNAFSFLVLLCWFALKSLNRKTTPLEQMRIKINPVSHLVSDTHKPHNFRSVKWEKNTRSYNVIQNLIDRMQWFHILAIKSLTAFIVAAGASLITIFIYDSKTQIAFDY